MKEKRATYLPWLVSMALRSLHAKFLRVLSIVSTCNNTLSLSISEKLVLVKMRCNFLHAKGVIALFVNIGDEALNANIP